MSDQSSDSSGDEFDDMIMMFMLLRRRKRRLGRQKRKKKKRKMWVRDIFNGRKKQGVYNNLVQEIHLRDRESYFRYMRMSPDQFQHLLSLIEPLVTKDNFHEPISAGERLSITLRFLATS